MGEQIQTEFYLLFPLQYCKNYLTGILESMKTLFKTNVNLPV